MADISNNTLAVLVGLSIMVSLIGIFSVSYSGITGAQFSNATQQVGEANFTIANVVAIILDDNSIQFGSGIINGSIGNNATLDSFAATTVGGSGFVVGNGTTDQVDSIRIRNAGNGDFALDVNSSATTAQFIGGSASIAAFWFRVVNSSDIVVDGTEPGMGADTTGLYVGQLNDTAGACASGAVNGSAFGVGNFSVAGASHRLCDDFQYEGNQNEMDFFVQLRVPEDATTGTKSTNLTFIATG